MSKEGTPNYHTPPKEAGTLKKLRGIGVASTVLAGVATLTTGCERDADIASRNLSQAADMFEIDRRIVFYNGITDTYMLTIEGRCSIQKDKADNQLEVTCKTGENGYKKHFLGISDNVTYFAEQLDTKDVSTYHHRVVFKPQAIIPDVDFRSNAGEMNRDRH